MSGALVVLRRKLRGPGCGDAALRDLRRGTGQSGAILQSLKKQFDIERFVAER